MRRIRYIASIAFLVLIAPQIAMAQMLQVLWVDARLGPICNGPMGPGPCQLVAQWISQHGYQSVGIPLPNTLPTTPSVDSGGGVPSLDNIPQLNATVSSPDVQGAIQCAAMTQSGSVNVDTFLTCTHGALVLNHDSATLVSCAEQSNGDTRNLALCAGRGLLGSRLTPTQMKAVTCATSNNSSIEEFAGCVTNGMASNYLSRQQQQVLGCAMNYGAGSGTFASCAGQAFFGGQVTPETQAAIDCAMQSQGNVTQFGGCAANKFLNMHLNPEQQIALQCVVSSGGQPYVAAGCTASQLTGRELQKCFTQGIGGRSGCFGDNNDLVGRNGFVVRNIAALAGGPNSVINNPAQILGGPNSVFNNPRQVLGGPNSVVNQALRNVPSPPPIQVGKIGGHRVCIPWC